VAAGGKNGSAQLPERAGQSRKRPKATSTLKNLRRRGSAPRKLGLESLGDQVRILTIRRIKGAAKGPLQLHSAPNGTRIKAMFGTIRRLKPGWRMPPGPYSRGWRYAGRLPSFAPGRPVGCRPPQAGCKYRVSRPNWEEGAPSQRKGASPGAGLVARAPEGIRRKCCPMASRRVTKARRANSALSAVIELIGRRHRDPPPANEILRPG